jgi:hypothetical protein
MNTYLPGMMGSEAFFSRLDAMISRGALLPFFAPALVSLTGAHCTSGCLPDLMVVRFFTSTTHVDHSTRRPAMTLTPAG